MFNRRGRWGAAPPGGRPIRRKRNAIPMLIILLLAVAVGYLFLREGDDPSGTGRIDQRAVGEGWVDNRVKAERELFTCPKCGGEGGFQVGFRKGTGLNERTFDVVLVCPRCGFRFTVGDFRIPSDDPRLFDPSIDAGH